MKFGIVKFPGSNCDYDAYFAVSSNAGASAEFLWHKGTSIPSGIDAVVLPGGFSFGDYLRCGAVARFSPIMREVVSFAQSGGYVVGICNGFQILTECHLLPGALLRNASLKFIGKDVQLRVENTECAFTSQYQMGEIITLPVAHNEGNYFASSDTLERLEQDNRVVFRYCSQIGDVTDESNPNGAIHNIAGILNERGNVFGLMPHPERYCDSQLGSTAGLRIFSSLITTLSH